jgi:iron complex outermembrane receptor protein
LGGGAINPKPTTGINWTLGLDYTPDYIPGLSVNTTWWNTTIKGENKSTSGFANPAYASGVVFCTPANGYPAGCPTSVIDTFARLAQGAFLGALPAGPVWYLNPGYQADSLYVRGSGIDFDANYIYDAGSLGVLKVGDFLSLITRFELGPSEHVYSSILGQGSNGNTISAVEYTNRASFGWVKDSWAVDFWVNYTPGYHNTTATAVNVVTTNSLTGYANTESGDIVKSNTTVDMNIAYTFPDGVLNGDQIYVHGINILNTAPPFFSGNIGGIGAQSSAFGYNPLVSSPLGREISVGLRAKF